ncbi:MAG: glycogen synthase GlgA [Erysipelotrichales bacterium]|nr:glycogen synthase GlgA [Erysipelotrichales bacterium]
MKILFAASECAPYAKTGGLADVIGALPLSLARLGIDVSVILPYYKQVKNKNLATYQLHFDIEINNVKKYCGIFSLKTNDVTYYFIDNEEFFYRDELYGHYDDGERFAYFSLAILETLQKIDLFPDVIHCNDWQTAAIPHLLKRNYQWFDTYKEIKTVLSIHNIQFQGIFPASLASYLNLKYSQALEFDNNINFLKAGIVCSDLITTVSETYRDEILTEEYGYRLNDILSLYQNKLFGIINGIDIDLFNPKTDQLLHKNFDSENAMRHRYLNKRKLQKDSGLPIRNAPLFGLVSRLTDQKGLDLFRPILTDILNNHDCQFYVMGSGELEFENYFKELANSYPEKFKVFIGYNEALAQKIYSSINFFLMPSKFEPCGLSQLISMRYGGIPIVRETGGLKDTVIPYNKFTKQGSGFSFKNYQADELKTQIEVAIAFYQNKKELKNLTKQIMNLDFSWENSSRKYLELYQKLTN